MSKKEKTAVLFSIVLAVTIFLSGIYIADKNTKEVSGYLDGQTVFKVEFGLSPSITVFNKKIMFGEHKAL